jgi:hypothetical protein
MVRLTRARPFSVSSAFFTSAGSDNLRIPTLTILAVGTRSVILSLMKLITNNSSLAPAISCSSIARIWPTPWAGYTTNSLVLKPWRWVAGFLTSSTFGAAGFAAAFTGAALAGGALCAAALWGTFEAAALAAGFTALETVLAALEVFWAVFLAITFFAVRDLAAAGLRAALAFPALAVVFEPRLAAAAFLAVFALLLERAFLLDTTLRGTATLLFTGFFRGIQPRPATPRGRKLIPAS